MAAQQKTRGVCLPCSTLDHGGGSGRCTGCIFQLYFSSDRLKDFDVLYRNCGFYLLKEKIQLYHEEGQHLAKEWIDHKLKRVAPAYCLKKKREAEWTFMHKKIDDSAKLHVKQKSEAELALLRKTNEDLELDKDKDGGSGKSVNGRNRSMKAMGVEDYIKEIAAANVLARTIFGDAELLPEWKDVLRPAKRGRE